MKHEILNTEETANSDLGAVSGCCKCVDCGKEFDDEPSMYRCSTCKGKGCVTYLEKKRCKPCKFHYVYNDEEDEPDDYYCDHCGRACNCH